MKSFCNGLDMHFTECRRLDLASMAHTIEVRCPFLDKDVYSISNICTQKDLINNNQGKQILRKAFENELPDEILKRNKMSFDVGSGIRKMVVEYLTKNNKTEKEALKEIWSEYFPKSLIEHYYFHSYPTFDELIAKRGISHPINLIQKIEKLLLKDFKTVPFHNIFMLNHKEIKGSHLGGTCSDKVLHFKKVLKENHIESKLHSAIINDKECHRMLSVIIHNKLYFIDVGSGWVNPKLIPSFEPIEYSIFGYHFKTEINDDHLFLYHKTTKDFKLMIKIPLKHKSEDEIYKNIEDRYKNKKIYPFSNSLRFSLVINDYFYFIKGNRLRIYSEKGIEQQSLSKNEIKKIIEEDFSFNLENFKKWYTPNTL